MHPRNPYRNRPNFKELALKFPEFRQYAKQKLCGKVELNFKDPAAVRALTTVLLKKDFNLEVELPPNRLVPTLPLRLNYLLWIEDLITLLPIQPDQIHGLDIGTGACCIYPILGATRNKWHFTATETDDINYECSQNTVEKNNLSSFVTLKKVGAETMIIGNIGPFTDPYTFSMCNPPFFDSDSPDTKSRTDKRHAPMCPEKGGSTSSHEISFKGGEVQFIKRLIDESRSLKSNIRIFTTMLGHKSSLEPILAMIEESGATWSRTEFSQGRTTRWGVAWTYDDSIHLTRCQSIEKPKIKTPLVCPIDGDKWKSRGDYTVTFIMAQIVQELKHLKMEVRKVKEKKNMSTVEFTAQQNTWTHQRRKRRQEEKSTANKSTEPHSEDGQPETKKLKLDEEPVPDSPDFPLKGLAQRCFG
nr:EOG090X04JL [Sida crystallina]